MDNFTVVGPTDTVLPDEMTFVEIDDQRIILTRWRGVVCAFSSYCPHAAADLAKGILYRGRITCPDHGYKFDIGTGRILWPEDEACRLKCYVVKEEAGVIKVKIK